LDPEHLPKYEKIGAVAFLIARAYDDHSGPEADEVQEITRKIAFFVGDQFLITVHRTDQTFFAQIRESWKLRASKSAAPVERLLSEILRGVVATYEKPIDQSYALLSEVETQVFEMKHAQSVMRKCYFLKRKASVYKRMLKLTLDILPKVSARVEVQEPVFQDIRENAEALAFFADEINDSVAQLLSLHLSLQSHRTSTASHKTNEVMRVLTLFSVFFLPLNFIVGLYGMNFKFMPELENPYGYPAVVGLMLAVTGTIYFWFRRRGWLK
ncbi:MAG: CorA family divalent cation transporter, partial [Bdellovibrionota bacterium]